jgi:hypothetical protein
MSGSDGSTASVVPAVAAPRWVPTDDLRAAIHEVVRENAGWGVRKVWA